MNDANVRLFVEQHAAGKTTPEDKAAFMQWLFSQPEAEINRLLESCQHILEEIPADTPVDPRWTIALNNRIDQLETVPAKRISMQRWWAAAAVLLLAATGAYFWATRTTSQIASAPTLAVAAQIPVMPGSNKAVLTLADGSMITLDSAGNRVLQQGNTSVQQKGGQLIYQSSGNTSSLAYNTLRTPRGGEFHLSLPDGTEVWLNAASSLRYPTAFTGRDRTVEITGEAYFEVAKDATKPFKVRIGNNAGIDVLGTSFNVNSYSNEKQMNITLVNGTVRVFSAQRAVVLQPGQQAQLAEGIKVVNHADVDKTIAWKNGAFNFDNVGLEEAMRQLERWYNIDVVYENGVPDIYFGGELSRSMSLNDLLLALEKSNVHFRIDGQKLVVTK